MKLIDLHCDTLVLSEQYDIPKQNSYLRENSFMVDTLKLAEADSMAQFFALFINTENLQRYGFTGHDPYDFAMTLYQNYLREMDINKDRLAHANNYSDMKMICESGKIASFLTIEEGGILNNDLSRLEDLHNKGVRLITLMWNIENCIAYPNSTDSQIMNSGLKPFGRDVIEEMNQLGMIIDVSHMSDAGVYDVLNGSKAPVIASHSNARTLNGHPRNLTDNMIRKLADKGGIIGINFAPQFVYDSETSRKDESKTEDIVKHMEHIRNMGGIDVLAIGSDFDGIQGKLEVADISQTRKLIDPLKKRGFTEDEIEKIWNKNALRIIKDVM